MQKAVFLDKDGTLIYDIPYNADPARIMLQQSVAAGLRRLQSHGYLLIIISNQSGVAHGYFTIAALKAVKEKIEELLAEQGIILNGFYYCPHHPEGKIKAYAVQCDCRKPLPGLFLGAAKELNIDLSASWMIGDILHDVEAGNRAGCQTILIDNGNETEWQSGPYRTPAYMAASINAAADFILQQEYTLQP